MMATKIATVSLFLAIVILQHLYNWLVRRIFRVLDADGLGLYIGTTAVNLALTYLLARLVLEIN